MVTASFVVGRVDFATRRNVVLGSGKLSTFCHFGEVIYFLVPVSLVLASIRYLIITEVIICLLYTSDAADE